MRLFNLHGYHGSAHNSAYAALESLGYEIISPSLDYDSVSPANMLGSLKYICADRKPDAIVGTSFGGFYAAVLSALTGLPVILINPCLLPFEILPKLGYQGDIKCLIPLFGTLSQLESRNVGTIIGGSDEVILTHDFTKTMLYNTRYRVIPDGKHSGATLPLEEFFVEMLHYFTVILPQMELAECYPNEIFNED